MFQVQLQQVKYKQFNSKLGLEMGINLIKTNENVCVIRLLDNINFFVEESSNPMIGTEQAMVAYNKRKAAIETDGKEIRS
ncbi:hypothetical protein ECANGB1_2349 [Enterospora canceri]|uniref:Uncharacterized protein n=1 Tax=Enterospora canceri TaxID=1081671 RepID=A0A1Y1S8K2_9MICR|nr:hypothetical protein ECANGB1_2349 [Enterospora canceri]